MGSLTYDGRSSAEFFLQIERYPAQPGAARKYSAVSIPGRNGDLHFVEGAFSNYTKTYSCYFHKPGVSAPEQAHAIKGWLLGDGSYRRLTDSYDPNHFHLAAFLGTLDVENILNKYGRCELAFDCDPRAFSLAGETPVSFSAPSDIVNPEAFPSTPLIVVHGSGAGSVTIGGTVVTINAMDGELYLDSENENAYSLSAGVPVNQNGSIYAPEFPRLQPGENSVAWTGGVTGLEITPRWWTL